MRLIFCKRSAAKYLSRTPACCLPAGRQGWQESRERSERDLVVITLRVTGGGTSYWNFLMRLASWTRFLTSVLR
jgi:hypothetical protein